MPPSHRTWSTSQIIQRSDSCEPLEAPDIDAVLKSKRKWYHSLRHMDLPLSRRWHMIFTGLSIGISALQANGVYSWPTYGPVVARQLQLDATQAQTIVVGGILGVYVLAAPLGSITDRYGPRVFVAACLSAFGYLSFAALLSSNPGIPNLHLYLTLCYFAVGAATVGSYFACLTTASLSFPQYPTLALSIPLSLLGLSSLVLSSFSTHPTFQTKNHELDARKFIIFLGILCPSVNLFGSIFMRVVPQIDEEEEELEVPQSPIGQLLHLDEHTPLLIGGPEAGRQDAEEALHGKDVTWTVARFLKDWEGFWLFGFVLAMSTGPAETVIASIGAFLTSLMPHIATDSKAFLSFIHSSNNPAFSFFTTTTEDSALVLRNKHVFILSLASTFARLFTGITADLLSPPLVAIPAPPSDDPDAPTHFFIRKKKQRLSRSMYAALCALSLAAVFGWSAGWLETEKGMWVLSGGTGALYGTMFTLAPAIVSAHFGPTNFGLAWGMVSYFAAVGSVLFSYLYALLAESVAREQRKSDDAPLMCYGSRCFRDTLAIAAGCCVVSAMGFVWIGKRWRV